MRRVVAWLAAGAMLVGCASVAPPPLSAAITPPGSWRDATAGEANVDPQWWLAFGDPDLDAAVEAALLHNTKVLTAVARVAQARAEARLARSQFLPTLGVGIDAARSRAMAQDGTKATVSVTASWEIDLFGRIEALSEAARSQYLASQADQDAMALSVAQEAVKAYIDLVSFDEQVTLTTATIRSRADSLRRAEDQSRFGYTSRLQFLQARGEYEAVLALLPTQQLAVRTQENALAILVGDAPRAIQRGRRIAALRLVVVPLNLPSALVRRRPDIASTEFLLASADETIRARRAEFLPQLTLSADYGRVFTGPSGAGASTIWSAGGSLLAPLFRREALQANLDVAVARRDQAAFAYKAAVLNAFKEVENALTGQVRYTEQVTALNQRIATARQSLVIAEDRYAEGYSDFLSLLDVQRQLFSAQQAEISAQADRLNNIAALAAALGGGWDRATLAGGREPDPSQSAGDRSER